MVFFNIYIRNLHKIHLGGHESNHRQGADN